MKNEISRRRFIQTGALATFGLVACRDLYLEDKAIGGFDRNVFTQIGNSNDVLFLQNILHLPGLPRSADNTLIVTITDLHYGNNAVTDRPKLKQLFDDVSLKTSEFVESGIPRNKVIKSFIGDFVNQADKQIFTKRPVPETYTSDVYELLGIMSCNNSTQAYFSMGNHDQNHSMRDVMVERLQSYGYTFLNGDRRFIDHLGISIVGLPDYTTQTHWYQNSDNIDRANSWLGNRDFAYLMTHNITGADKDKVGIEIQNTFGAAGHSHWGHYSGTGGVIQWLANRYALHEIGYDSKLVGGLYRLDDDVNHLVSSGIGDHPAFTIDHISLLGREMRGVRFVRTTPRMVNFTLLRSC